MRTETSSETSSETVSETGTAPRRPLPPGVLTSERARAAARARAHAPDVPAEEVPADAVLIDAATGTRAWPTLLRAPRGVTPEPGALPGTVQVQMSHHTDVTPTFRIEVDPPGALRCSAQDGIVRPVAHRDFATFQVTGLRVGRARVLLRLVGEDGADAGPVLELPVEVRAQDEDADPLLGVVTELPAAGSGSGAMLTGDRRLAGLRGALAGFVRVRRSGFRDFASQATELQVAVEDPAGILEPLPRSVTIPAGATEPPEPLAVRLRDADGSAVIRFRAGGSELSVSVQSRTGAWKGPDRVVLPVGSAARVPLRLEPAGYEAPQASARAAEAGIVSAEVLPTARIPEPPALDIGLRAERPGETRVEVTAPYRPALGIPVTVVPAEAVFRGGRPVLLGVPSAARGAVVLRAPGKARFAALPNSKTTPADVPVPAGVRVTIAEDGRTATATFDGTLAAAGDVALPVELQGTGPRARVLVADALRSPQRWEYTIDANP